MQIIIDKLLCVQINVNLTQAKNSGEHQKRLTKIFIQKN